MWPPWCAPSTSNCLPQSSFSYSPGLPGTGKTHTLCALGHRLVEAGRSGLSPGARTPCRQAQPGSAPPAAQAGQLRLPAPGRLGYLPQDAEESEVLFTLTAERYERRSLGITSNLVFSEWERIFANPMATAAAIDRVVHHSVILKFDVPSYRTDAAQKRGEAAGVNRQK